VVAGVTVVLLHLKEPMHRFVDRMGEHDMSAIIQFVVISLIILPLLPDRTFGPYKVLNPFDIWRMVVLIVGISLVGYIVYKIWGERAGTVSGGILGGLISSTATTVSYARRSREAPGAYRATLFVILIASAIAYGRVLIEISAVAPNRLAAMAPPLGVMLGWMTLLAFLFFPLRKTESKIPDPENPAEMKSALIFGAIYAVVIFAIGAAREHLGSSALYGVAIISGLTDMDAITLSTARLVEQDRIETAMGWRLILTASLANLVFKAVAGFVVGGWRFGVRLALIFVLGIAGGLAIIFLWPSPV